MKPKTTKTTKTTKTNKKPKKVEVPNTNDPYGIKLVKVSHPTVNVFLDKLEKWNSDCSTTMEEVFEKDSDCMEWWIGFHCGNIVAMCGVDVSMDSSVRIEGLSVEPGFKCGRRIAEGLSYWYSRHRSKTSETSETSITLFNPESSNCRDEMLDFKPEDSSEFLIVPSIPNTPDAPPAGDCSKDSHLPSGTEFF